MKIGLAIVVPNDVTKWPGLGARRTLFESESPFTLLPQSWERWPYINVGERHVFIVITILGKADPTLAVIGIANLVHFSAVNGVIVNDMHHCVAKHDRTTF